MERDTILPLILKDEKGSIVDVLLESEKGHRKSIEQRIIWYVHKDTGRLLPYKEQTPFKEISKKSGWYEALLFPNQETLPEDQMETSREAAMPAAAGGDTLARLAQVIRQRRINLPEGSYTTHLFTSGEEKIRKKTGEEAVELILARNPEEIVYEAADLIYHMLVMLEALGIDYTAVLAELDKRSR
ncbi:phosphoribosyl-ATP diphosphatase [Marispirochaeta sp.]|uniref:phosphoribosyl-ATP diphosphatase n=1 Tax=Marispirochaeta sp. TaxID=2038653 RepID=UPI0029C86895|nr:phosphoribosyl-ATP diphosphatase [Marispirochaeta sp.]